MPHQSDATAEKKIGAAAWEVVKEEAKRQEKSWRSISLEVSEASPNLLYQWSRSRRVPMLSTLMRVADALQIPAHELVYRIERRLET